jgi:serine/threonine protein kinase
MLRYASDKFYGDGVPLLSPPPGSGPSASGGPSRSGSGPSVLPSTGSSVVKKVLKGLNPLVLGLIIATFIIAMVLVGFVLIWKRKYKKHWLPGYYKPSSEYSTAISKSKLNYKFQTLQIATKNFNLANKIGQGGFGSVYKGVLLDGREIAVKRLFANKEQSVSEFFNEVNLISQIQHKNLVNLLGFSVDGPEKLLVYEYLPNKSLDRFLFEKNMGKLLDWQRRFEIILGTAGGLAYLHQESHIRIIHRDMKASNILLDQYFKPKIADFGLVRHFSEDQTHLSTAIVGTRGYMAPEYLVHGHLTEKVDVYAFGVLVLEIISGKMNINPMHANDMPSLLTMIWNHYLSSTVSSIIDPNIEENCQAEVLQVVQVALLCTQASATLRPSMSKVIMFLTSKDSNLPTTTQPPFIDVNHLESNINIDVMKN